MILAELGGYLRQHHRVSLRDLACRFDSTPAAMEGMLARLECKGRVRRHAPGGVCGGCCQCEPAAITFYEWVAGDAGGPPRDAPPG